MAIIDKIRNCKEFRKSHFGLSHDEPDLFLRSQWPLPTVVFLSFRWIAALYILAVKIYTAITGWKDGKHFIYLTNWTYTVLTASFLIQAVNSTLADLRKKKGEITVAEQRQLPWYIRCQWVVYNVASSASLLVTITFWSAIYHGEGMRFTNFNVHAINSILVVTDLALSAVPVRLFHMYQPMFYVVIYGVFSLIFWATGGTDPYGHHYIYKVLDFGNPKLAAPLSVGLILLGIPLVHAILFGLVKLRVFIHSKLFGNYSSSRMKLEMSEVEP